MPAETTLAGCRICTQESRVRAVERVIATMRERLDEPLTLKAMARIAYISPFHFNRVFHQITGIPPAQFLYAMRLETAKHLLLTTERSVTDVCYDVGYNSLGTFTTRFTQLVGLSPGRLRRLADHLTPLPTHSGPDEKAQAHQRAIPPRFVTGLINAPDNFDGTIFAGLFQTHIPQSRPVGGTFLTTPGAFRIGPVPDGRYYAFAAAFPKSREPLVYLLPNSETLLVGVSQVPIIVRNGLARGNVNLALRPVQITDPPILIALPSLLEDNVTYQ
jgi:AraC family transcriptional regulator